VSVVAGFEAHPNPVGAGQAQPGADTLAHRQPLDPGPHPLEFGLVLGVYQLTQVGIWWPRHPGQGWCQPPHDLPMGHVDHRQGQLPTVQYPEHCL